MTVLHKGYQEISAPGGNPSLRFEPRIILINGETVFPIDVSALVTLFTSNDPDPVNMYSLIPGINAKGIARIAAYIGGLNIFFTFHSQLGFSVGVSISSTSSLSFL